MKRKTCGRCKKTKPLTEFSFDRKSKDGRVRQCKECVREYYLSHIQEAYDRVKKYRLTKDGIASRVKEREKYYKRYTKEINQRSSEYWKKYPERNKANHAVNHAVERGELQPVSSQICFVCQRRQAKHYHHHRGYDKQHWLDVIPVCRQCHEKLDKSQRHASTNE